CARDYYGSSYFDYW
nr:immunoglobulin heavy chain junction region [Mus musculus]MBK4188197.1 immunoglobulin heavy chain junction region [Mus musculus]MBK4188198.1 immunoglobulin heavy chain junction region [Mus musculus]MBK4188200.1 immunoglobulin heavy chain junction region [Mus musculus]